MTKKALLLLLLAAGVTLSACSSDKKTSASSSTTSAVGATTTVPRYTGDKNSDFCRIGADFNSRFENLPEVLSGSADNVRIQLNALKSVVNEAKASAPDAIKSDTASLATVFDQFFSKLESTNYNPGQAASELAKLATPEVQTAVGHVQAYGEQVCGIGTPSSVP
jgi:hypothetical protein